MKTLLRGGIVVSGSGAVRSDVLIEDGRVAAVGLSLDAKDASVSDVSGMLLFPGFIDAHTHFDLDVCGTTTADDFYTGGRSAIRGGTTTVIDFACPNKGESLQYGLELWRKKAEKRGCACDYGFHMTIDDWNPSVEAELPEMFRQGVTSFKAYMAYPAMMVGDRDLLRALRKMKALGGVIGVHCENGDAIDALIAEKKAAGQLDPTAHPQSRPAILEAEAVSRLLKLASVADVPVVIVHLSSAAALREVRLAREAGQKVYVETCPQYLLLDDRLYALPDFGGGRYVCAPPLRKPADCACLWQALANGEIQTVSTDHCSFTLAQKDAGRGDFTKIPGGLPGVETRGTLLYTAGVDGGRITLGKMCELLSENPAKLYGLWPRKGVLAPGSDADIVVYDPEADAVITAADHASAADYAPFEGYRTKGSIAQVYLRGTLTVDHGEILRDRGGCFLARERGSL